MGGRRTEICRWRSRGVTRAPVVTWSAAADAKTRPLGWASIRIAAQNSNQVLLNGCAGVQGVDGCRAELEPGARC